MKLYGTESNDYILKELGNRIKDIRIGRSMTQKDLAEHAGVSFSTIVRIEKGIGVNTDLFLKVLYSIGCLPNIDILVPEQNLTPKDIYLGKKKRQRASKAKDITDWVWEDEKK